MSKNIFGDRLKQLRTSRNITRDELATILEIAVPTVGSYERGTREPSFSTLIKIADLFGVSIDYLMGYSDEPFTVEEYKRISSENIEDFLQQPNIRYQNKKIDDQTRNRIADILFALLYDKGKEEQS